MQGVLQFLATYRRMQHLENDPFFYGDELEPGTMQTSDPLISLEMLMGKIPVIENAAASRAVLKIRQVLGVTNLYCKCHQGVQIPS